MRVPAGYVNTRVGHALFSRGDARGEPRAPEELLPRAGRLAPGATRRFGPAAARAAGSIAT